MANKTEAPVVTAPVVAANPPSQQLATGVNKFLSGITTKAVEPVVEPVREEPATDPVVEPELPTETFPLPDLDAPGEAPPSAEPATVEPPVEASKTKSINYFKGKLSEKETRIKELEATLEANKGKRSVDEIAEAMAELRTDPEYQQKFVTLPQQLFDNANNIAASYGVGAEELKQAIGKSTFKELNEYLRTMIDDDDARGVIRGNIQQIQQIYAHRREVDSQPFTYVDKIMERKAAESLRVRQETEAEFESNSDIGWQLALEVAEKHKTNFPELVEGEDSKWNETVVRPAIAQAEKLFQGLTKDLASVGARLPQGLAQKLATMSQAYAALGMKIAQVNKLQKENTTIKAEMERLRGVGRPSTTTNRSNGAIPAAQVPKNLNAAVGSFLDKAAGR